MEQQIEKLFETEEGSLMKVHEKARLGFDSGSNLGLVVMMNNHTRIQIQMDVDEINLFAFWLNKNFELKLCPDFKQVQDHEELKKIAQDRKEIIKNDIERMSELNGVIKRCVSTFKSIMEVEEVKGDSILSLEAKKQINSIIDEVEKIHD